MRASRLDCSRHVAWAIEISATCCDARLQKPVFLATVEAKRMDCGRDVSEHERLASLKDR
jgi:hypothetical protein